MFGPVDAAARTFDFWRDTFAYRNELYWEYLIDEKTGHVTTRKNDPPPTYAHRCFVVVRCARQFFWNARFDVESPKCSDAEYAEKIREVARFRPKMDVVFPGFASLRDFSDAKAELLKANCGGAWQSYFNKQHWRMIFPFSREHQAREAERLKDEIGRGNLPIIHIVRFPQLTINHALLLYGSSRTSKGIDFTLYDPNIPERPSTLHFNAREKAFLLPRNHYWSGGRVDVYETYRS